jgi:hypothetical protein
MAKKKRKSLLPKRIAGVKVPKSVRRGPLGQLLASRTGQALLAEAIMAAGAVGVAKQASDKGDDARPNPPLMSGVVADALRRWQGGDHDGADPMAASVAYALGEAARTFVRSLDEHRAGHGAAGAAPAHEVEGEWAEAPEPAGGSKKKPAASAASPP